MGVIAKFINKYEKMTKEFSLGALTKTSYKLNHFLLLFSVAQEIRKNHDVIILMLLNIVNITVKKNCLHCIKAK